MEQRPVGRTGLSASTLAFGTAPLGGLRAIAPLAASVVPVAAAIVIPTVARRLPASNR